MKKCPICEINYINDEEEVCSLCNTQKIVSHHNFDNDLTEDDIISNASNITKDLYLSIKEKLFAVDKGLTIHPNISNYISIKGRNGYNICAFWFTNSSFLKITLHTREGNLIDPKGITYKTKYDFAKYAVNVYNQNDIEYALNLILQVYNK